MSIPLCHYCSLPINTSTPVVLWDGETYCSACVDAVDPMLSEYARTHPKLVETLTPQDLRLWPTFTRLRTVGPFLVFLVPMFSLVYFFFAKAIGKNDVVACCGGTCCLAMTGFFTFLGVLIIKESYEIVIGGLPRTVRVSGQNLLIETPCEQLSVTLARCNWFLSFSNVFRETEYLPRGPAIILHHPSLHPNLQFLPVGLTPEMYRIWYAFLTLSRVRNRGRFLGIQLLISWMVGIPSGIGLGVGLGQLLKDMMGDNLLPLACGLLGGLDGFCIPTAIILGRWLGADNRNKMTSRWRLVGRYALAFGLLGVGAVGSRRGVGLQLIPAGLSLIVLNACIGFVVGWWFGRPTAPLAATNTSA